MTLPLLGAALTLPALEPLRDWIFGPGRAIEIQDFLATDVIARDTADLTGLVDDWAAALDGHGGPRGLHGPFLGLDLANPDPDLRRIIRDRLQSGLWVADRLGATQMVVHSPFTHWHAINRTTFADMHDTMLNAMGDCLGPVLDRAEDIGCTLVLENIEDTVPQDRADAVHRIAHPRLRLSVDTGHAEIARAQHGAPDAAGFIADAGPLLAHVHLHDTDGQADRHWHPGAGAVAWDAVFAALPASARPILEVGDRHAALPDTAAALEARGLAR